MESPWVCSPQRYAARLENLSAKLEQLAHGSNELVFNADEDGATSAASKCTVKQWISGLAHQVQANKSVALRAIESNVKASAWDCCIVSLLSLGICMAKTNQLLDVAPSNTISV